MVSLPVSVIIPCRNQADTLKRAVESAFQAGAREVSVFDDKSTDHLSDVWDTLLQKYPFESRVKLGSLRRYGNDHYILRRVGAAVARNQAIGQANHSTDYDLIIPLDADDVLLDIQPLLDAYQPGTWVYGNYIEVDEINGTRREIIAPPPGMLAKKNICHATMLFHKDDWQRVGGYDPDFAYAEDYAFQCALTNAGITPVHVSAFVYERHIHQNERTAKAMEYWTFYRNMCKQKYPNVFADTN